ncbi:MAG TPA: hypothetical protein VMA54_05975 [Steroidobacteraceae bacterium]|nr:hypothetical protein [Steroidobacteraceae bacterium]
MNAIQKVTFAVSALAITLVGAALVTAPIAFARPLPVAVVAHSAWAGGAAHAGLVALNGR